MYNIYIYQIIARFVFIISIYIKLCQCGKTIILSTKGLIQDVTFQLRQSTSMQGNIKFHEMKKKIIIKQKQKQEKSLVMNLRN
jgi:hypothetical protein